MHVILRYIFSLCLLFFCVHASTQILDHSRSVDWRLAGLRDTSTIGFSEIDMEAEGLIGDGTTPNDLALSNLLSSIIDPGVILNFPAGNFLFNKTIHLPGHVILRGQGVEQTIFTMDLNGAGHSINVQGKRINSDTTSMIISGVRDSNHVFVAAPTVFKPGDWVQIIQFDTDLITSSWAEGSVGQIVKIREIIDTLIEFDSPLRMDFSLDRSPFLRRILPVEQVGIECLKIHRMDDTAPEQSSNINYVFAVNCWVSGIESENCTFSHIQTNQSSNLSISTSYFHHGFGYGGGGRAYGVMLQFTSNECLVENNVFEHLRHSMILQAGANGNVFAYNYSLDPFWDSAPNNSAGDAVLHGNYVYANLFEQNICQNIVIDNSHGPNGPYNTFFRNRAEGFGIFFSATNSPDQNIIGNEIPNLTFPYSFVNYTIQGIGHFLHGNNNKGAIHPVGTNELVDSSYAYIYKPVYVSDNQWAGIGAPNPMGSQTIPAYDRYQSGGIFSGSCGDENVPIVHEESTDLAVQVYPNPVQSELMIESTQMIQEVTVMNALGQIMMSIKDPGESVKLETVHWIKGIYFLMISDTHNKRQVIKLVKA